MLEVVFLRATEAAQLAGLNHSYRARQSTLCSREGSTN